MTTQAELFEALESLGRPVEYSHFDDAVEAPYLTYRETEGKDFKADNINFAKLRDHDIELYTETKDLTTESLVEDKLDELGLSYSKTEAVFIDAERLYQTVYTVQLGG